MARPQGIGLNLGNGGDLVVLEVFHQELAAIAGGHDPGRGQTLQQPAALGQGIEGGGELGLVHHLPALQEHQFDGAGTDVDPRYLG